MLHIFYTLAPKLYDIIILFVASVTHSLINLPRFVYLMGPLWKLLYVWFENMNGRIIV